MTATVCCEAKEGASQQWGMDWACATMELERLEGALRKQLQCSEGGMGHLEEEILKGTRELQRKILENAVQHQAAQVPPECPRCGRKLTRRQQEERTIETRFGPIRIRRIRGYCSKCKQWFYPADLVLGLDPKAGASPSVQEMAALTVSKMPVTEAKTVIKRLAGVKISESTLDRQARRQGQKAQEKLKELDEQQRQGTAGEEPQNAKRPSQGSTLVIQIDAWNIRERDEWGKSGKLRAKGEEPSRWHWVYSATVFRLSDRVKSQNRRAMILSKGVVSTRQGKEVLQEMLWAEARRRGLGKVQKVLVIADGAIWIWNLAQDRFKEAEQRLDYYHASEHLWAVAHELFERGSVEARAWIKPLLRQLKAGRAIRVIAKLKELLDNLSGESKDLVERELTYFQEHQGRMNYGQGRRAGEPIGSGAIESCCRQYQCRFKRPGQFWTKAGDEALLTLENFWRNNRWHLLFPHAGDTDPSRN